MKDSYFKWDKDWVTGMSTIDNQHHGLIGIINNVLQLCFDNEKISESTIEEIYNKLILYVLEHFETEEQLMKEYLVDHRHADVHYRAHAEFKDTVGNLFLDFSKLTNPEKLGNVIEFLIRWLAYHILNIDKSLVRQINLIDNEGATPQIAYENDDRFIESSTEPLLKALSALFHLVSVKNKELTQANFELEEKVRLRTLELMEVNIKLEQISVQDELTGIPNRRYAIIEIEQLLNNWKRYGVTFSILFIDVDKFKLVNDIYGHEYGDKVLKWLANFLKASLRKTDISCRIGGDEFLVICSNCDVKMAMKLGEKINEMCRIYNLKELDNCWEPSLSIGVAEVDNFCETTNDILKKADHAMYIAKKNGGGHAVLAE